MPPRYVYWTILIDGQATAFRARDREELLPTFNQLAKRNTDIAMKYFARGKLWDTPEQAEWAARSLPAPRETRSREWRPGGTHEDPRARFKKGRGAGKSAARRPARPASPQPSPPTIEPAHGKVDAIPRKSWSGGKPRKPR